MNRYQIRNLKTPTRKNNFRTKIAGFDQMTNEIIKYAPELLRILTHIFNQMFKYAYTPSDFNFSLITPSPKKCDRKSASDLL